MHQRESLVFVRVLRTVDATHTVTRLKLSAVFYNSGSHLETPGDPAVRFDQCRPRRDVP